VSETSQKRALKNYRRRLGKRGMARFEVLGLDFPKSAREFKEREKIGDNRFWPGVIVGMKVGKYFGGSNSAHS
jgi:hypothetical protein